MYGENNPNWKGGRTLHSKGYIYIYAPDHPNSDKRGYIFEHRLVASKKLGRPLKAEEITHHRDLDKQNNTEENVQVFGETGEHSKLHAKIRRGG